MQILFSQANNFVASRKLIALYPAVYTVGLWTAKIISRNENSSLVMLLGCWKWFNGVLKEANVEVTDANKAKVEDVIHKYIGEQASYGRCSNNWTTAHKQIKESLEMRQELIEKLKKLAVAPKPAA
jgi:hypothetical protein